MGFPSIGVVALKVREACHDLQRQWQSQAPAAKLLFQTAVSAAAIVIAAISGTTTAVAVKPIEIAPHRAAYLFELVSTEPGSGIAGVTGGMTFEWADTCDGWALDQHYLLRVSNAEGLETEIRTSNVTWESKDGLRYRFNLKRGRGRALIEDVRGDAQLKADDTGGVVEFSKPRVTTLDLPAGTKFPTSFMFAQMRAAFDGSRMERDLVFEGGSIEGPQIVTTAILPPRPPQGDGVLKPPLGPYKVWPMYVAYFPADDPEGNPETEIALDVQANGVVPRFILDYGAFKLRAVLARIEPIENEGC